MPKVGFLMLLAFLVTACGAAEAVTPSPTEQAPVSAEVEIRALVESFATRLQEVSLLAPDAAEQIREKYAGFVSEELLAAWMADPDKAPGRLVSSPWPDRIEIDSVVAQPDGSFLVTGSVIEITSTEVGTDQAAAEYPIEATVSSVDGNWRITNWVAGEYE